MIESIVTAHRARSAGRNAISLIGSNLYCVSQCVLLKAKTACFGKRKQLKINVNYLKWKQI